ncbi:MAG TPA: glycosyltransferase family 39 protein [Mycobacterium sp.]|nr:glycosyltransferase family 39 protein [Mycobacterium sp.]
MTVDLSLRQDALERVQRTRSSTAGRLDSVVVAAFAIVVSAAGAARPSLWFDEAATISAGTRSVPALLRLLGNVDAVHGLYYLLMHGWFAIFPATEFWTRVPSCLAVGVAAAGVVVLGRQFSGRTLAVSAGIAFSILPRVTWAGIEGRPYALATACAVWLTVLAVAGARRDRAWSWVGYALALTATTALNLFVVLIVLPHAVTVVLTARRRSTIYWWAGWCAVAMVAVTPFVLFTRTQIAQVRWISPLSPGTLVEVLYEQYFDLSAAFAVAAGALLAFTVVLRRFSLLDNEIRCLLTICTAWIVLPTVVLVAYSAIAEPMYYPRYLCYTSPAVALLLAVCITALARSRDRVTAILAVLALAATPNYLFKQRGPYAKEGMDFSQIADLITERAAPDDCLILDNTVTWLPGPVRSLTAARPHAYEKLTDPGRGERATDRNRLWDAHTAIWAVADQVQRCTVLWTVSDRDHTLLDHEPPPDREPGLPLDPGPRMRRAPAYQVPQRLGFHIVERWQFSFAQVTRSTR